MKALSHILLIFTVLTASSCNNNGYTIYRGYAQGGEYRVIANMKDSKVPARKMSRQIEDILTAIDTTLSGYNRNSMLSRFNAGEEIVPNKIFLDVLAASDRYKDLTGGAFDAGAGPLFDIWGFGFKNDSLPSQERIAAAMEECKLGKTLNFNAIAQGYTCDTIASYLRSAGVVDVLVDIGEIYCSGLNASGKGWTIGIDTPEDGNDRPGEKMSGIWESDGEAYGVVTSGNYRKFYVRDGKKYAHTIDPRTGYPVSHNLLSATVVAPTATDADALATFFMVIGFDEAKEWVLAHNELEACLITTDSLWRSPGF